MQRWSTAFGTGVLISIVAALAGCGSSSSEKSTAAGGGSGATQNVPLTYRLDWLVGGAHTCYYRALNGGYFKKQGLDVKILEGSGSGNTATLVANGQNDFGFSDAGV